MCIRDSYGEREIELGPAVGRTLRPYATAVRFHNSLCNRQSKTRSKLGRRFRLPIPVKYVVKVLWRDSRPRIGNGKANIGVLVEGENPDLPTFRREFDRIAHQILDHLE